MKNTKTRKRVLEKLSSQNPMTASDLYDILKDEDITLSSIYRTLDTFTKEEIVIKDTTNNGTAIYTLKGDTHNHFLECKKCHKKITLEYCPYHKVNEKIKKTANFTVDEHNVVIYGTCKDCNQN
ncbi:MAG: transcriptional repressor [Clostridiales bacterium]|nr:transcriptional repressor [Clostridiales bacterium]